MTRLARNNEGSAMIVAAVSVIIIVGISGGYLMTSVSEANASARSQTYVQELYAADAGMAIMLEALNEDRLPLPLVAGQTYTSSGFTITTYDSTGRNDDGDYLGLFSDADRNGNGIIDSGPTPAAEGRVDEEVDEETGLPNPNGIDDDGDGKVDEDCGGVVAVLSTATGVDEDLDGLIDEEGTTADGVDNDSDGKIDEDLVATATSWFGGMTFTVKVNTWEAVAGQFTKFSMSSSASVSGGTATLGVRNLTSTVTGYPEPTPSFNVLAAVTSNSQVDTLGNLTVDGRDHDENGVLTGPGTWGITGTSGINNNGSSASGGNGIAPTTGGSPAVNQEDFNYATDDTDHDGQLNEDPPGDIDGDGNEDDDGDGRYNEDGLTYPPSPDAFLGAAEGTLEARAKTIDPTTGRDTYYTDERVFKQEINDFYGGKIPSGRVVYLAFDSWGPPNSTLSSGFNAEPSILVQHNSSSTALASAVHVDFKGLMLLDRMDKTNGNTNIIGALATGSTIASDISANGTTNVLFSSSVLTEVPVLDYSLLEYRNLAWRDLSETGFTARSVANTSSAHPEDDPSQLYAGSIEGYDETVSTYSASLGTQLSIDSITGQSTSGTTSSTDTSTSTTSSTSSTTSVTDSTTSTTSTDTTTSAPGNSDAAPGRRPR